MKDFLFNPGIEIKNFLVKFFLTISICYFFCSIFFGLDFTDSFYHLNQALDPADGIYLYPFVLSSIIIKTILSLVGPEIIYLRFINSILLFFSILMPFFFIKVHKPRVEVLLYIACGLFLFNPFNVNILGYDTLSIFILSVIFSISVLYLQKSNFYLLLLVAFISSVAVLIRLPNLLVIPIVFFGIVYSGKIKNDDYSVKPAVIYLLFSLLLIYLGYSIYYQSLQKFFQASANATSHHFSELLYNYLVHGFTVLLYIFLIMGGYIIIQKYYRKGPYILPYGMVIITFVIFLASTVILTKYSQNYALLLTALAISIVLIQINKYRKNGMDIGNVISCLFLLFIFINPFGSNTGLLKATSLFLLFPFVLSMYELKLNFYWVLILSVVLPFSIIENFQKTYEDNGIISLDKTLNLDVLHSIHTTNIRAGFLEKIDFTVKELEAENTKVYFYGDKSHIFHYIYPNTTLNINSFFQPVDDLIYYSRFKEIFKNEEKVAIFIIDSYPSKILGYKKNILGNRLLKEGFKEIRKGSLVYFLKQ